MLCLSKMLSVGFRESSLFKASLSQTTSFVGVRVVVVAEAQLLLIKDISPIKVPSEVRAISLLSRVTKIEPFCTKYSFWGISFSVVKVVLMPTFSQWLARISLANSTGLKLEKLVSNISRSTSLKETLYFSV